MAPWSWISKVRVKVTGWAVRVEAAAFGLVEIQLELPQGTPRSARALASVTGTAPDLSKVSPLSKQGSLPWLLGILGFMRIVTGLPPMIVTPRTPPGSCAGKIPE